MEITVDTGDLRQALRAVTPHIDPSPDFPQLHRVRLDIGPENLTVSATNRYTLGYAIVSIWDRDGEVGVCDLSPTDVKEILTLFHGKSGTGDDGPSNSVLIDIDDKHITITDVSGLFPGKSLKLPRYPMEDNFPNVGRMIQNKLTAEPEAAERLITNGKMLGLFMKAAAAYAEPLVIDPAGQTGAMLVTCGESFVGMLMPIRPDDETIVKINGWHADWRERISAADYGTDPVSVE